MVGNDNGWIANAATSYIPPVHGWIYNDNGFKDDDPTLILVNKPDVSFANNEGGEPLNSEMPSKNNNYYRKCKNK